MIPSNKTRFLLLLREILEKKGFSFRWLKPQSEVAELKFKGNSVWIYWIPLIEHIDKKAEDLWEIATKELKWPGKMQ